MREQQSKANKKRYQKTSQTNRGYCINNLARNLSINDTPHASILHFLRIYGSPAVPAAPQIKHRTESFDKERPRRRRRNSSHTHTHEYSAPNAGTHNQRSNMWKVFRRKALKSVKRRTMAAIHNLVYVCFQQMRLEQPNSIRSNQCWTCKQ